MVRDGYYYAGFLLLAAVLLGRLTVPLWGLPCVVLAAFFLWFFRDPERTIPDAPGAIVSAADGKITDISQVTVDGELRTRVSIFLNVFDVHVTGRQSPGRLRTFAIIVVSFRTR
jgi:phosphatidylserine decarboxylase